MAQREPEPRLREVREAPSPEQQSHSKRTRNIFILFRLEHMKQKDIAAFYGIGQSTVEKHVMKAVLHLTTRYSHGRD